MRFLNVLATLATAVHLAFSRTWSPNPAPQHALMDTTVAREKVPGDNPAYYTREKATDQLFKTTEFIVSPAPPLKHDNNRVFFYLAGTIPKHYPELANCTLTLRSKYQGEEYEFTHRLSDARIVTVRKDGIYGGPLKFGTNEIVGDQELMHWGPRKTVQFYLEVLARLPDERLLFAFEADLEYTV